MHDHLDHCLEHSVGVDNKNRRRSIEEFKLISKYL